MLKGEIITSEKTEKINVRFLRVDPLVKRESYDPRVLKRIEENIRKNGFRNEKPLVVRPDRKNGKGYWKITCGQHRFEAGINSGICTFPCVKKWSQDDIIAIAEAYEDNVIQCQVDAITEAQYFKKLGVRILKGWGHSNKSIEGLRRKYPEEQIALQMGVTKPYVTHRLALLRLPKEIQWFIRRYYIPSEKGLKLNPTIGEELSRLYRNIIMQYEAGTIKTDPEKAIIEVALKFSREKTKLEDVRKIAADIAYKNYDVWSKTKYDEPSKVIRCTKCGDVVPPEDNPWLALCHKDKEEYLNHRLKPNPHLAPSHEKDPDSHVVKNVNVLTKNVTIPNTSIDNSVNLLNSTPHERYPERTIFTKYSDFVIKEYSKQGKAIPLSIAKKLQELREIYPKGDKQDEEKWEREAYFNAHPEKRASE